MAHRSLATDINDGNFCCCIYHYLIIAAFNEILLQMKILHKLMNVDQWQEEEHAPHGSGIKQMVTQQGNIIPAAVLYHCVSLYYGMIYTLNK